MDGCADRYQVVISSTKKNNAEQGKELQTLESLEKNETKREWVKSKSIFMTDEGLLEKTSRSRTLDTYQEL